MFTTTTVNDNTADPIMMQSGIGHVGSCRQESVVIIAVLGFSTGIAGPEVTALVDTPSRGIQTMTLPGSAVEIYTIHDEPLTDYDRM
jgi:hypothetical protein